MGFIKQQKILCGDAMTITEAINKVQIELLKNDGVFSQREQSVEESIKDAEAIAFLTILRIKLKGK